MSSASLLSQGDDEKDNEHAVQQHPQRSGLSDSIHFLLCAGGILLCYFYFGLQQERIIQGKYEGGDKFTYTQALVFFLCAANTIFAWVLRPKDDIDTVPTKMYAACAASYLLAMIFSNQALQYLPYPTQVLAKSCKPIPVIFFGVFFARKSYIWRKYVYVAMIVIGCSFFLYKDKKTSRDSHPGPGELLLVLSLAMDGTTTSIQDLIKKSYRRSALSMMFFMNLYSTVYLAAGLFLTGELFEFVTFLQRHPHIFWDLIFLALSSCGGQYFIFKTVHEFSPLTCSIITTTRKLFTIIISVVFMNHPLTFRQTWSTAVVFAGLALDALDEKLFSGSYHSIKVKPMKNDKDKKKK